MRKYDICDANKLSLGLLKFYNIRKTNTIYVDKTNVIAKIAKKVPIFFLRPRGFGKTLLVHTLSSLFTDGLEYCNGLDIEEWWNDKKYQVVHLDFSSLADKSPLEFKRDFNALIIERFGMEGKVEKYDELGMRSPDRVINEIAKRLADNSVVLLIDEYDAPLVHTINNPDEFIDIMEMLNNFYAIIKQYIDAFRLVFITGVTRVGQSSMFSVFNNQLDISLDDEFNQLLGFTLSYLERYYDPYIENAAKSLKIGKDDLYQEIKLYYGGFQFSLGAKERVYNPWSLLNFFSNPEKVFLINGFNLVAYHLQ
ncbi:MAG: AAA family ATPase [Desulfovibrionaceae bacterium]|nr:AAA family ATPase [Desulfovibrionaceae bacterium]